MDQLGHFSSLFAGSTVAYGEWVQDREPKALTRHGAPTTKLYKSHLEGETGLGIIPVTSEGNCHFGAIDVDIDTINHAELFKSVAQRGLPLNVCRSKSGGSHLYMFANGLGVPATHVRQALSRMAAVLGYPTAEIFPKQNKSTIDNVGNWINLPYFGGDATTRYSVGVSGARSLDEFLNSIVFYDPNLHDSLIINPIPEARSAASEPPPCLSHLRKQGIQSGARNIVLFNFAIFYRKSSPEDWEAKTRMQNSQYTQPPLDSREVDGLLTSASRGRYQYTCDQEPLRGVCNKAVCSLLPYGVNNMPWDEKGQFTELITRKCRKLTSDPPRYILEVNGRDLEFSWEEFSLFPRFKSKVEQTLDIKLAPRKQPSWDATQQELFKELAIIEAPEDAGMMGLIIDKLHEFLVLRERATEREDVLRGLPIQEGEDVLFRAADFKRYLQNFKLDGKIEQGALFSALRNQGSTYRRVRINGRLTLVWTYPVNKIQEQKEDFKIPDFAKDLAEEV